MTDAELLKRFTADGDESAFRTLAGRHSGLVYHTALRSTADPETAREVCQSVFLLLAQKSARLDASRGLAGWLHRTATLQARNARRGESRRQHALLAMRQHQLSNSAPASASHAEGQEDRFHPALPHLDEAVERLPERDREVLLAHYYTGRTYREIAEMGRETEAAVQRRASRAMEKLAVILRRQGLVVPVAALAAGLSSSLQGSAPADVLPPALPSAAPAFLTLPLAGRAALLTLAGVCATAAGYAAATLENPAPAPAAAAGAVNISAPPGALSGLRPLEFALAGPAGDWRTLITEAARDLRGDADRPAKARAALRLSALRPAEFAGALDWAAALPQDDTAKAHLIAVILGLQSTQDPAAAWAAYGTFHYLTQEKLPEDRDPQRDLAGLPEPWAATLFLKLWDHNPAAALAALAKMSEGQEAASLRAGGLIQNSAGDRARWNRETEKAASEAVRFEAASMGLGWALRHEAADNGYLSWVMGLPFKDSGHRLRLMRSLTTAGGEYGAVVDRWIGSLEGSEADESRQLILKSLENEPEEIRIRFAGPVKDPALKQALLKSL